MKLKMVGLVMAISVSSLAQQKVDYRDYKEVAKYNLKYLDLKGSVGNRVALNKPVLEMLSEDGKSSDMWINWSNIPGVVAQLELGDHHDIYNGYHKTVKGWQVSNYQSQALGSYHPIPTSFEGMVVALDAGHFASNYSEAVKEQKYVKFRGNDLGVSTDVTFYEAFLNDVTVFLVKRKLEEEYKCKVVLSKEFGNNSLNKSYDEWYQKDFKADLAQALKQGDVNHAYMNAELASSKDAVFNSFFRFVEFRRRIDKINDASPALTVSVHFNAREKGRRDEQGYLTPTNENYSMAFVPGAFMKKELQRDADKLDFLRLLLSTDLDKSMRLAHLILEQEKNVMGIPPVADKEHILDDFYCAETPYDGVYCRNLALTRTIRGPIVYLEALLQDNKEEALRLSRELIEVAHPDLGKIKVPKRCVELADAIVQGISNWLDENKSYASVMVGDKVRN